MILGASLHYKIVSLKKEFLKMKVDRKGNIVIIKDTQGDLMSFAMKLTHEHKTFAANNIIVDLLRHPSLTAEDLLVLLPLSKVHCDGKQSFAIVADVDFNAMTEDLVIVPTLMEANDIIAMEEIERDLGF